MTAREALLPCPFCGVAPLSIAHSATIHCDNPQCANYFRCFTHKGWQTRALAAQEPDGWVSVPTDEMVEAGIKALMECWPWLASQIAWECPPEPLVAAYKAMLAAAKEVKG